MSELLGADTDALDRGAESLSTDGRQLQDIRALAQRAVTELQASWNGPDLSDLILRWEQASRLLAGACASLDTCAAQLRTQSTSQRVTSNADSVTGPVRSPQWAPTVGPEPLAPPPTKGSPAGAAAWWRTLSPSQQQQVVAEHPAWIGRSDGIPFAARDLANRALLSTERTRLLSEQGRIVADAGHLRLALAGLPSEGVRTYGGTSLEKVKDKLASLAAIQHTLDLPGDRQLLLLDLSKERAQAAIAQGDVDTADNVAVFVPGLSTSVSTAMVSGDKELGDLRRQTEMASARAHTNLSAATVMWIGYQAPQVGWGLVEDGSVAREVAARRGAAQLVPFLQGIGAARDKDAHLTLLGHSYGSTTAGLALQQGTGVDDAVFFGSPGLGTSHIEELKLPPGHAYYVEARLDPVGDLGRSFGPFGIDPSHLSGIEHTSAQASTVVDPLTGEVRHLKEVTGHSSYLLDNSTSQYNMSVVAAGLPEQRVRDDGEGFGDVLSWPIPGTY